MHGDRNGAGHALPTGPPPTGAASAMLDPSQRRAAMSIGAQLRASREARGLTLDAVSRTTRVQPRILAAIERDDVAAVPPRPFGRGFVRAYAAEMGLDAEQITHEYFARFAPQAAPVAVAA